MPVDYRLPDDDILYQRDQYAKTGLGRQYWDFKDRLSVSFLRGPRIFDLGCGEGITLERIIATHPTAQVEGIDASEENIRICRRHGLPVQYGDLYHLAIPDRTADSVLCQEVIEHLEDHTAALQEMHRILKPGGRLVLMFPNDASIFVARIATLRFREAFYDPHHCRKWDPAAMKRSLRRNGFLVQLERSIPFVFWPLSFHCVIVARKRVESAHE